MASVDPRRAACDAAWKRVPALKGVKPSVSRAGPHRVFTFKGSQVAGPGGRKITQFVKVTVSDEGKVIKVVASR